MRLQRRQFLFLLGLLGFGAGIAGAFVKGRDHDQSPSSDTGSPSTQPGTPDSDPAIAAKTAPILRFVAIADSGAGDKNQYDVAAAMTRYYQQNPYPLVVLAGDNIYDHGEIEKVKAVFEEPYAPLLKQGVKFRACLGNHDIRTANGNPQVKYAGFNMKGRYYTFREKSVQFFALDTNHNADWQAQLAWLEQQLRQSDAPWKIVFGHHPIYSSGHYGTNSTFVKQLAPLFKKYGVQLYINGHEHNYERTRPIDGTTYLITGIGGAYLRPVTKSAWTAYSTSRYGFSALTVYADRIEISAIGTDHQVFDQGTIPIKVPVPV